MKVNPRTIGSGIIGRLAGLCKSGHDTEGHLDTRTVKDRLIESDTDRLAECAHDLAGKVNVGILKNRVANRDVCAYLVAIDLNVIENKIDLVQIGTALRPDRFRNGSHDIKTAVAA